MVDLCAVLWQCIALCFVAKRFGSRSQGDDDDGDGDLKAVAVIVVVEMMIVVIHLSG